MPTAEKNVFVKNVNRLLSKNMADLQKFYQEEVVVKLQKELGYKNKLALPRLLKIIVNMGLNDAVVNRGIIEKAANQLSLITGQKPLVTKAKKSISAFKLRRGMPIGVKVTLRGKRMFDFFEKLVKIVLPRQRDFKGVLLSSFDGRGNLNLGFKEQTIFPDLDYDKIDKTRGVQVTIVTSATSDEEAKLLLQKLGIPFKN